MRIVSRFGGAAALLATAALCGGVAQAQQAAAPAAATPVPTMAGPGGKQVPNLNGIWGGNLVGGGTSQISNANGNVCPQAAPVDAFNQQGNARFSYQGRTGSQFWVTFEQDCGIGHRGKLNKPLYK